MKIKTIRQSGNPVKLDQLEKFDKEFKKNYDAILEKHGMNMEEVHKDLQVLDKKLADKYDTIVELTLPSTKKTIQKFVDKYGNYLVSVHRDTNEPMLIIMDVEY